MSCSEDSKPSFAKSTDVYFKYLPECISRDFFSMLVGQLEQRQKRANFIIFCFPNILFIMNYKWNENMLTSSKRLASYEC